jgi:hypothetical protein
MTRFSLALLLLAACNTPGPGFRGVAPTRITVQGSTFDVRIKGDRAEAIRVNTQYAPRLGPIGARAQVAIEGASGCRVREMGGDQAQIVAELACTGAAPAASHPRAPAYRCWPVGLVQVPGPRRLPPDIECRPI